MAKYRRFKLVYDPQAIAHIRTIPKKFHSLIRRSIEKQLLVNPLVETRNRKPLDPAGIFGDWELRFGPENRFRVFYWVDDIHEEVLILAIGEKQGNHLRIGGKEVEL